MLFTHIVTQFILIVSSVCGGGLTGDRANEIVLADIARTAGSPAAQRAGRALIGAARTRHDGVIALPCRVLAACAVHDPARLFYGKRRLTIITVFLLHHPVHARESSAFRVALRDQRVDVQDRNI